MSVFRSRGFTLIELMVTVAIAAILLTIGVPSFTKLMTKNQLSGEIQTLQGTINFARSEAIKRGSRVSICKSNNQSTCSGNWSDGWIIFVDRESGGSIGTRDGSDLDADEPLLRVFPALPSDYTLNTNSFTNYITYNRLGMANNNGTFVFCKGSDETTARAIIVTRTRPRIATDVDSITSCESP